MNSNKPLKVLVVRNAYQKDAGGAEQYALNLSIALKRAGHKPTLVTKVKKIHEKARAENIKVVTGPWHDSQKWDRAYYFRYPLFSLWYMWTILIGRIDVVNPQSRDDFVFATIAARILRRRVIWTDHADLKYILDNVNHYNPRMRNWVIRASRYASAITVASSSEKKSIEAVAPELKRLTIVHNGVFLPENVAPVEKTNKFIVGTNARLVEAKGIAELMEGFAKLERADVDLWLLGGTSGNKTKYENLASKLNIAKHVKFWDYVSEPNNVVAAMDVFVHASYHEAFSLAIIEAAMLGRPIIATKVGGTPEIIDNKTGILIEPKSPDAIYRALEKILDDKNVADRLGAAAQHKAVQEFDFQKIVENKIIPLYRDPA
jgi:glycosyltransferase involved in cell wall biosynthesis